MTFSGKKTKEREKKKKKSLATNPTNLKNPMTINHNQNPQTQQNNGISKTHKSSKTITTNHMHQQIYKHFKPTKSSSHLLYGFLTICHRPPTTDPNQQSKPKPTKLQHTHKKPISSIIDPNQNWPTTKPITIGPPQRQRVRWNQWTYHHNATGQTKWELEVMDWKVGGR